MTCECNDNKKYVFCQNCLPKEDTWLVPVESVPDPFFMDRHHAYITKDNRVYVLSEDRTQAKEIGGSGGSSIDLSNYALKEELETFAKKSEIKSYEGGDGIAIKGSTISSPKLGELEQAVADVENTVYNTTYTRGVKRTGEKVTLDDDFINKKLIIEKVDAVRGDENYFPSVNNTYYKEYNLEFNPFDKKVVNAHLKIDFKGVDFSSIRYVGSINDKDLILYIPINIAEEEWTLFTQTIKLIHNALEIEIDLRAELTPTKMVVDTHCHLAVTENYQTIYREEIDFIGNQINFSKEMPDGGTVNYTTRHVPYVGLILSRLSNFKQGVRE